MSVEVGGIAPDFALKDQDERQVRLSDFRGRKRVVLSFHPLAWTGVCQEQMQDLEELREDLGELKAVALGLSVDSVSCKRAWAKAIGIKKTSLLADFWPHGEVARAYGVFRDNSGFSERAVVVVGLKGVVQFKQIYPIKEVPDMREIFVVLERL